MPTIVFEDDFAADTGWVASPSGLWQEGVGDAPSQWDGFKGTGSCTARITSEGVAGSNALRLEYDQQSQPTISLGKHLTGDKNTGYEELYIRYHVWFPGDFAVPTDGSMSFWKWGRLWQNRNTSNIPAAPGKWSENEIDSGYIVWNFGSGNAVTFQTNHAWTFQQNDAVFPGSSGGERTRIRFNIAGGQPTPKDGHFENVGSGATSWDWDWVTNLGRFKTYPTSPGWHTIEWRVKLATSDTANDGIITAYFDGVEQSWTGYDLDNFDSADGDPADQTVTWFPTAGSGGGNGWNGMNFLVLFDNMAGWNDLWASAGVDGNIRINDVVIATDRIGHSYVVGDVGAGFTGTSSLTIPMLTLTGTAESSKISIGSATMSAPMPTMTATGVYLDVYVASGVLTVPMPTLTGSGTSESGTVPVSGSGSLTIPMPTITGSGTVSSLPDEDIGTASLTVPMPTITGTGTAAGGPDEDTGTASLTVPMPTITGTGTAAGLPDEDIGTAVMTVPMPTIVGLGSVHSVDVDTGFADLTAPMPYIHTAFGTSSGGNVNTGAFDATMPMPTLTAFGAVGISTLPTFSPLKRRAPVSRADLRRRGVVQDDGLRRRADEHQDEVRPPR